MTNRKQSASFDFRRFDIHSSFVIRAASFRNGAVTIIELLVVIIIILILAGLILSISSYVQNKGARARAETEIAAMSAALESYKADNGIYPRGNASDGITAVSDRTYASNVPPDPKPLPGYDSDPRLIMNPDATTYNNASFVLYAQLSGNLNGDRSTIAQRSYFQFKPNMLYPKGGSGVVTAVIDPFGNTYVYSTAQAKYAENPAANPNYGFNPTFDLWSTAGTGTNANQTASQRAADAAYEAKWIKNW